jgi:hypothetical protein
LKEIGEEEMKAKAKFACAVAIGLVFPGVVLSAELGAPNAGTPNVVFDSWNSATRTLTLRSGLIAPFTLFACVVAPEIAVPATIAAGRPIYVTYTGPGLGLPGAPALAGNTCSQISFL